MTIPASRSEIREHARRQGNALASWDADALRELGFSLLSPEEIGFELHEDAHHYRAQHRAMSAQIGTAGAYSVPSTFEARLEMALLYASAIRDSATVVRAAGNPYRFPTVDDTGVSGFELPENSQPSPNPDDVTTIGQIQMFARKWTSGIVVSPFELVEDAPDLFAAWLGDLLGRRIARGQNTKFTVEVLAAATKGRQATSATAISGDDLIELVHAIDPAYRESPGFCIHMHNSIAKTVRELKDASGRYLFKRRKRPGQPDTLLGHRLVINRDMASTIASGNITAAAGDFSKVVVRDTREARLKQMDERYADVDQIGFAAFLRSSVAIADAGTHPVQYLQH